MIARRSGRPTVALLVQPALVFIAVWLLVLGYWLAVGSTRFYELTGSQKQTAPAGLLYLGGALALFVLGIALAARGRRRTERVETTAFSGDEIEVLRRFGVFAVVSSLAITLGMLLYAALRAGGIETLVRLFIAQTSWSVLYDDYFAQGQVQGLTAWVHLNLAAAPIAVLGAFACRDRGQSPQPFQLIFAGAVAVAVLNGVLFQERIAFFEFAVAASVAAVGYAQFAAKPVPISKLAGRAGVALLLCVAVWVAGEYGRTYLPRFGPDAGATSAQVTVGETATRQFEAYLLSNPNNALQAVSLQPAPTYAFWSLKGVFSTLGLDAPGAPVGGRAQEELDEVLAASYGANGPFTTFSLPGYAYLDLSWAGLGLMFWFGVGVGVVYAGFRRAARWGLLLYPLIFVGVLDSFRICYWTDSRMLIPAAFLLLCALRLHRVGRS